MQYESNIKHKLPWQRGRRGSLCPRDIDASMVRVLFANSEQVGKKRYSTYEGRAYCAQKHSNDLWHGDPIGWEDVLGNLRRTWLSQGHLRRRDVKKHWDG